jgi:TolB-like protein/methylphosphotriester-DNA--protein-cysteine methyltransferase/predicted Zn-dependent protease
MAQSRAKASQPRPAAPSASDILASHRPIPHDLKRAIDYIRNHVGSRFSIADLVAHCGVPERTLHKHFHRFMAISPLEFWRQLRLSAVRACLLESPPDTSITEVATRFDFGHLGRFSQDYRRHFGESPSVTLQRSRIDRRECGNRSRNEALSTNTGVSVTPSGSQDRPSIALLPLQNSAVNPDCSTFGEYVAEAIATALCRVRSLSVKVLKRSPVRHLDQRQGARDVGARYLLVGRIAQTGSRLRIIVRLLDAETEAQIWGDIYDGLVKDLFGLADRVTVGVMRALVPQIHGSEIERARRKRPQDLAAYGLTMRAFPFVFASNPAAAKQALEFLRRAIEMEPDYAPATALAAWCHAQLVLYNGTPSMNQERSNALSLSERAGILDPDDPIVLTARCAVHTMAGQLDHAESLVARALELDPTLVWAWERSGWLNAYAGNAEAAVRHFEQATRLDPRRPNAPRLTGLGCAYFHAGRYEESALWKRAALREDPGTAWINRSLSVTYARLGDRFAALDSLEALRRYSPDIAIGQIVHSLPFTQDFLDRIANGLDDLGLTA